MLFTEFDRRPDQPLLLYVMDPMCSWCWAFAPVLERLKSRLPSELPCYTLLGGLAPDSNEPMPIPLRQQIEQTWQQIEARCGTPFNYDFWRDNTPRRSTYPACRAVISAGLQQPDRSDAMITAIQRSYYLQARNPSDREVLIELAVGLGLEPQAFERQLDSEASAECFRQQLAYKAALGIQGFPTLAYYQGGRYQRVSHGYCDQETLFERLRALGVRLQ